ncbi:MAG TPA: alpha/beta fold hydrolase [Rubrivivax sp.]|nr:alpha/beta fold hydrolase [Rubrivivax sp.]
MAGALPRRLLRLALRGVALLVALALALALGFTLYAVSALPPLQPWHTELLREEFDAGRDKDLDFAGYLQLEQRLFDEFRRKADGWARDGLLQGCAGAADARRQQDCAEAGESFRNSRFNAAGWLHRLADGAPFNRTFRLTPQQPVGQALLVHGLTDSPYSMHALAQSLHARGFEVTVLRLPGHGTLPSMMSSMSARDWTAAVRLAARDVASRVQAGQPFYAGGYSSGGTLVLQYALDALQDATLRRPDRVLLVSPAIELTRVAMLAEVIDVFSIVPIPVLDKVRWQAVAPEFDPYKFNSFPVNASRQINRATRALQRSLREAESAGRLAQLPPVVAWQSVVDSTVGSDGLVDQVYARLRDPAHRLVMFDLNRMPELDGLTRPAARALIERVERAPRGYTLDVVTNADAGQPRIAVRRLRPGGPAEQLPTTLDWPGNLVSLGHVALPFPADDPVYGFVLGSGRDGIPSIGSWLLRGENGAISISLGSLTRLRSNPFWPLIDADVGALVAQDVAAR